MPYIQGQEVPTMVKSLNVQEFFKVFPDDDA